jgi:hypothetical protein
MLGGPPLASLFQNISIIILLVSLLWIRDYYVGKVFTYWLLLFLIISIYIGLLFLRSERISAVIQVKFIFILILIYLIFLTFVLFKKYLIANVSKKTNMYLVFFLILFFAIFFVISYSYFITEFSSSFGRGNSSSVRDAVNRVMLVKTKQSFQLFVFGHGLGASAIKEFDIGGILGRPLTVPAHSGLFIFFYEHGVFGVGLLVLTVFKSISGLYQTANKFKVYDLNTKMPLLIVLFIVLSWVGFNLIIIFSIPGPDPFWSSGLTLYLMLWVVIIRDSGYSTAGVVKIKS